MARRHMLQSAGARLAQLRIEAKITREDLARVYGGGKPVERIEEIEASFWLNLRVVHCYKAAVEAITLVRNARIARESGAKFENLKIRPMPEQ